MNAPATDIDHENRGALVDIGADELTGGPGAVSSVLDDFNRPGVGNTRLGSRWYGPTWNGQPTLDLVANQLVGQRPCVIPGPSSSSCSLRSFNPATALWQGSSGAPIDMGADQEAGITLVAPGSSSSTWQGVVLKAQGPLTGVITRFIEVRYSAGAARIQIRTTTNGGITFVTKASVTTSLAPGTILRARALAGGSIQVFVDPPSGPASTSPVATATTGWGAPFDAHGAIGLRVSLVSPQTTVLDDFRGGAQ